MLANLILFTFLRRKFVEGIQIEGTPFIDAFVNVIVLAILLFS
jgi:hypothetical protein